MKESRGKRADMDGNVVQPVNPAVNDIGDKSGEDRRPGRLSDAAEDNATGCGRG